MRKITGAALGPFYDNKGADWSKAIKMAKEVYVGIDDAVQCIDYIEQVVASQAHNNATLGAALSPDSGKGESIGADTHFTALFDWILDAHKNGSGPVDAARLQQGIVEFVAYINAWGRPAAHVSAPTEAAILHKGLLDARNLHISTLSTPTHFNAMTDIIDKAIADAVLDVVAARAAVPAIPAPTEQPIADVSAPTDEVTQEQAVLLAGIQALCISTNQELSRRDGSLSEFDKGWFLGQLHIFDMYTPVEKGALNEAREYLRAITSAQAPQQTMRSLYEIQRDAAESAIGDDLARLMLVDPAGKAK